MMMKILITERRARTKREGTYIYLLKEEKGREESKEKKESERTKGLRERVKE